MLVFPLGEFYECKRRNSTGLKQNCHGSRVAIAFAEEEGIASAGHSSIKLAFITGMLLFNAYCIVRTNTLN